MIQESRVLGPSTDALGLPSMIPNQQARQAGPKGYTLGQIHLAIEVFSVDQLKQLIKLSPECVNEIGELNKLVFSRQAYH